MIPTPLMWGSVFALAASLLVVCLTASPEPFTPGLAAYHAYLHRLYDVIGVSAIDAVLLMASIVVLAVVAVTNRVNRAPPGGKDVSGMYSSGPSDSAPSSGDAEGGDNT